MWNTPVESPVIPSAETAVKVSSSSMAETQTETATASSVGEPLSPTPCAEPTACAGGMKKTSIGGQALIEGIMMRGPEKTAMAVRQPDGNVVLEEWPTTGTNKPRILKLPFVRGIFNMVDSLRFGYKCLMRSAELAGLEDETPSKVTAPAAEAIEKPACEKTMGTDVTAAENEAAMENTAAETMTAAIADTEETVTDPAPARAAAASDTAEACADAVDDESAVPCAPATAPADSAAPPAAPAEKRGEKLLMTFLMVLSSVLGVALAVGLFLLLPSFLSKLLGQAVPVMRQWALKSVFEGVLRIALFVGYILLVSMMKDIRRVFMYHGAEHKAIFCYEHGLPLTLDNIRIQRRFHPRCGTSFLILVLLVGIVVSMFIRVDQPLLRTAIKLLTIPLVVGIGYELIKLAGRADNWFTRIISAPGMWLQHITTKEPTDDMIECAIQSLKAVIPADPDADRW